MELASIASCLPNEIHSFSQLMLDYYLNGRLSSNEFMRWFHMPNSEYLQYSKCIVTALDPNYDPTAFVPGVMDGANVGG